MIDKIVAILDVSDSPVIGQVLAERLDISQAEVRRYVNKARCKYHFPICSSREGYTLTKDPVKIQRTINNLNSRARKILEASRGLELYLRSYQVG